MDLIGRVLSSRYEILEKIGEGGMAYVYKAKCKLLNRFVAIKVLKPEYAKDDTFVDRFKTEAQSAAALTHPNIVSVYDVGHEDEGNINYIVMELLETKTLKDYIEEHGALSNELTLKIGAQIASALEAAHKAHIVHRDIKPQNIVLNQNMVAKVTDFGIAKITTTTSETITSFGSTVGSVHYFSPEHAKGGYIDEKSDLYSLGVVMYEMATGKLPFDGDSPVSVALKQIQEEPIEPIIANSNVSLALNQIILKAMQKSTVTRYQSATELLQDISQALIKPNALIERPDSFVEAGATQVIPIITDANQMENKVPNLRTRQARAASVTSSKDKISKEEDDSFKEDNDEEKKLTPEQKKKKKKKIIILSVIAAVVVIAIIGVVIGINIRNKNRENKNNVEIEVPDLVNKSFNEMVEMYKDKNIEILQDKLDYDSEIPEGFIISQSPEKGTKTKDKKIYVVVSKGAKMVDVTDVEGKDVKIAKYELQDTLGFVLDIEEVINEKVAAGIVISQDVKSGEKKPYGSTIKLKVSKGDGKESVLMPTVLGKTEAEAKKILEDLKLTVSIKTGEDNTKSNGVVIIQSYPQNQMLKEGTLVEITVNKLLITKKVTLDLLELQGGKPLEVEKLNVKVTASIDGGATNTVHTGTYTPETKSANFEINGYKTAVLHIYINDKLVKDQNITF
ncbi:MAG: Stk1 family PASTA domain-containing Ser/Thr kinase [Clostridia bacterium]|nr:Stk1 family PASTA domain-containing Ser/Thr kinase [Clostridia bacterium]